MDRLDSRESFSFYVSILLFGFVHLLAFRPWCCLGTSSFVEFSKGTMLINLKYQWQSLPLLLIIAIHGAAAMTLAERIESRSATPAPISVTPSQDWYNCTLQSVIAV